MVCSGARREAASATTYGTARWGEVRDAQAAGLLGEAVSPAMLGVTLAVMPLTDAAELKPQRITLSDGKTIDLKLPAGVEDGTQMRLKGKGQQGPGRAGIEYMINGHSSPPGGRTGNATKAVWHGRRAI